MILFGEKLLSSIPREEEQWFRRLPGTHFLFLLLLRQEERDPILSSLRLLFDKNREQNHRCLSPPLLLFLTGREGEAGAEVKKEGKEGEKEREKKVAPLDLILVLVLLVAPLPRHLLILPDQDHDLLLRLPIIRGREEEEEDEETTMMNEREVALVLVLLPMITKEAKEPIIRVLTPTLTLLLLFLAPNDMPE
jgi:hypothetical protein